MKKKVKNLLIFITFMVILCLKGAISYAKPLEESKTVNDQVYTIGQNFSIYHEDLVDNWYILCCQSGTRLFYLNEYLHKDSNGRYVTVVESEKENDYYVVTGINYVVKEIKEAADAESAYLLSFAKEKDNVYPKEDEENDHFPSVIQNAWWDTPPGHLGAGPSYPNNDFVSEAKAYKEFADEIFTNFETKEVDEDKLKVTLNYGEISATYSENSYIFGPFTLNYLESAYYDEDENRKDFCYISDYKIYDQDGNIINNKNWEFVWSDTRENSDIDFPHDGEKYYIRIFDDGNKEITGISNTEVNLKYLVTYGKYAKMTGIAYLEHHYKEEEWKMNKCSSYVQNLCAVMNGGRYYASVPTEITSVSGKITINKKALDEKGNELTAKEVSNKFGKDQRFKFKVEVGDDITSIVEVRAGESVTVGPFLLPIDSDKSYKITELLDKNSDWVNKEITNSKGTFSEGKNNKINVIATNQINKINTGTLKITKNIQGSSSQKFKFKVTVSNGADVNQTDYVELKPGEVCTRKYYWYGDNTPTYSIKEVETYGYESYINPSKGKLLNGQTINVSAYNDLRVIVHKNQIQIVKKLTQPASVDKTFRFTVKVKGYNDVEKTLTVRAGEKVSETVIVGDYYWSDNKEAPKYEIIEHLSEEDKKTYKSIINPREGILDENKNTIKITATNVYYSNYIELKKFTTAPTNKDETFKFKVTISNLHDINGNALENEVEYATVIVKSGETTGETEWYKTEDGGNYIGKHSSIIEWWNSDNAPRYKVEEIETEDSVKYNPAITPSEGTLADNGAGVAIKVDAVNKINGPGPDYKSFANRIQINKTITQPASEDEIFKFIVKVGDKTTTAEIKVNKGELTGKPWISEVYTWKESELAPTYSIKEIETESSKKYRSEISPSSGTLNGEAAKIIVKATNHYYENRIKIEKEITEPSDEDETFKFKVEVDGYGSETVSITIPSGSLTGETWTSQTYSWTDELNVPNYTVTELDVPSKYKVEINPNDGEDTTVGRGKLNGAVTEVTVNAKNTIIDNHVGYLVIEKKLKDNQISNEDFEFNVKVTGSDNDADFNVSLKAGEKAGPYKFIWHGDKAPTYTVTEVGTNWKEEGSLKCEKEATITATCVNNLEKHEGNISVIKDLVSDEKMDASELSIYAGKFGIKLVINGTFYYGDEEFINSSKVINTKIEYGREFTSQNITWYGDEAPTYYVVETDMPEGWLYRSTNYNTSEPQSTNVGINLIEGQNIATITNYLPTLEYIDLTFAMEGIVWIDSVWDLKNSDAYLNNLYDEGKEELKENVEVYIYKEGTRELATGSSNNKIAYPILTKADGTWRASGLKIDNSYYVEFVYDGQTYEAVAPSAGDVKNGSKAKEYSSNSTNISNVYGENAIDANGDTTGFVTYNGEERIINYKSSNAGESYPTRSELVTTNEDGLTLDIFKSTANTQENGLVYAYNKRDGNKFIGTNKEVTSGGIVKKYFFTSDYSYCSNINLGLKEKEKVDVELTKNLTQANVVVNQKLYQYNFNKYFDLTEEKEETLEKEIYNAIENEYTLGLYKSDYYYRAEMYNTQNSDLYSALAKLQGPAGLFDNEMDIYFTYELNIQNNSSNNSVTINSIDDYCDSSFELVREDVNKYITMQKIGSNGTEEYVYNNKTIVDESNYSDKWQTIETGILGQDKDKEDANIVYNKMTADGLNIWLDKNLPETKSSAKITLTYKVKKNTDNKNVTNSIRLGLKSNVAEIGSYSPQDGKIDMDSAPGNVNISELNSKSWYEDDTFAAPKVDVKFNSTKISVSGNVWEDNSNSDNVRNVYYNQNVGNGYKEVDESFIQGMDVNLVEKVYAKNNDNSYTEYDFIWPTSDRNLPGLGGYSIEELCGFSSYQVTDKDGKYLFTNIPKGDYVVRFTYGNKKIESADYSTSEYYNGQDYKSGTYMANTTYNKDDENEYIRADDYINIDVMNGNVLVNSAVDNEVRRLEVADLSRELTYKNTSIMANYDDELFDKYYMFADTAKLHLFALDSEEKPIENQEVKNIGFAIEERPITELSLDKQIKEIELTTSDNQTIMKAVYNITYSIDYDGKITATVELDEANSYGTNKLQALNRDEATTNGFRYINVDDDILQGATITVKYQFAVINAGEVDRTGKLSDYSLNLTNGPDSECSKLANNLSTYTLSSGKLINESTMGNYVGSIYYYGANSNYKTNTTFEPVVSTKVRQLVDYVDNDLMFDGSLNSSTNTSWSNVTTSQLKNGELISPEIITKSQGNLLTDDNNYYVILDSDGINYLRDNMSNVIVSTDNENLNSGLIKDIQPYGANNDNYIATMELTVSKYVGSDSDDLSIDNISEIIKYNNQVGRRDELAVTGNANPAEVLNKDTANADGTINSGMSERDTSVTETITMSPPTGISIIQWRIQLVFATIAGLVIIAGGIIFIKKKVLVK